jgi:hypothetical protein
MHHDPLGDTVASAPLHATAGSAGAAPYDPTGGDAATHHLTTIATGGVPDAMASDHMDATMPGSHDGTAAAMDPFGSHEAGQPMDPSDPAHAAPMHDPTFADPTHHDIGQPDPTHHDPLGADAVHHDPTGADATYAAPTHADPAVPEHPVDDPSMHAPVAPEMPQHDVADPNAYDPAMDAHDDSMPAYEPAPAMSSPDDDQY